MVLGISLGGHRCDSTSVPHLSPKTQGRIQGGKCSGSSVETSHHGKLEFLSSYDVITPCGWGRRSVSTLWAVAIAMKSCVHKVMAQKRVSRKPLWEPQFAGQEGREAQNHGSAQIYGFQAPKDSPQDYLMRKSLGALISKTHKVHFRRFPVIAGNRVSAILFFT